MDAGALTARGGPCTSPPRSGSVTPSATWRSPPNCARLQPDLEIDWLAQDPVTRVLETHGERIHPLSEELASESGHIAAESTEHELNAFQAIRRMDEILVNNFMVFHDAIEEGEYDLVIGDEAWDVDYYLHENPELKRTAFAWLTDFVGWLPMPDGGEREAFLTADYNAEMIEQIARFPRIRDRAIFVGDPDDIVPDDFGPGLPSIREWTEDHYAFAGYVTGFDPSPLLERREELREELGFEPDERVVVVTVGGSGVGEALLRRVIAAYPMAAARIPGLRMIAVAGPRIDPAVLAAPAGVDVRAFVPDLYRHLVACDLAVVQGGLTTTMELTAAQRPFLYFPLGQPFRTEPPRAASPGATRGRPSHGLPDIRSGRHCGGNGRGARSPDRLPAGGSRWGATRRGADRAAALSVRDASAYSRQRVGLTRIGTE